MKPIEGYDLVNANGEFKQLPAGIYLVQITSLVNNVEKEYFEITCDIARGEYAGYFKTLTENGLKDTSKSYRSYKSTALTFFKGFITAIEKSNPGFVWDWDENKLVGKYVIGVFREEEYINEDGEVKTVVKLFDYRSIEAFKNGDVKMPEKKLITDEDWKKWREAHPSTNTTPAAPSLNLDDLPF